MAWNEAEELCHSLEHLSDDEIIECKEALIKRVSQICQLLEPFASEKIVEKL